MFHLTTHSTHFIYGYMASGGNIYIYIYIYIHRERERGGERERYIDGVRK